MAELLAHPDPAMQETGRRLSATMGTWTALELRGLLLKMLAEIRGMTVINRTI